MLTSSPSVARAADDADTEALVHQGVELRKQGHNDLALPLFERAYKMAPAGRTAAQLGLVHLALDQWPEAEDLLVESLRMGGLWIEKNRAVLEGSLQMARSHLGSLRVTGGPDGASVLLDGNSVATLPMKEAIRLVEGRRALIVRADGFADFTKDLVIHGQHADVVEVHLKAPEQAASAAPGAGAPTTTVSRARRPVLPWALGAGAAGALVFGIVEHVRWSHGVSDFDAVALPGAGGAPACAASAPMHGVAPSCATIYDRYMTARALAIVGYGAAVALAATSAILFLADGKSPEQTKGEVAVAHACGPDLLHNGWQCAFTF